MAHDQRRGIWFAIGCYIAWGLLPLYWKALHSVPAADILANRMVWSLVFVVILLAIGKNWRWVGRAVHDKHIMLTFTGTALLLSANWYVYIWAVNAGFVVESSLGYFINPLVSVLLGVIFLHERLRPWQWASIGIAAAGVLFLAFSYGHLPWIALTLAFTFAFYGLLKKRARLPALEGMALETGIMFLPALAFLIFHESSGAGAIGHEAWLINLLLIGTGVITVIPLIWFAEAARRIPLSMLGILQYISPTLQFTLGVTVFHEAFDLSKLVGFGIIWGALLLYWAEGMAHRNRLDALPPATVTR
jgi:chloramphenicol-sensitive protein RarD